MGSGKKNWALNPTQIAIIDFKAAKENRDRQKAHEALQIIKTNKKAKARRLKNEKRKARKRGRVPEFFSTKAWLEVRYQALKRDGAKCSCCGATPAMGATMNVDHIKPRHKHPELALSLSNLQVLCARCNEGKGWRDETDWRPTAQHERTGE